MDYTIIEVPYMNDSMSRIVMKKTYYYIRFTYNDTFDYWKFGLYDDQKNPIAIGIKIVPGTPLNLFFGLNQLPYGVFGCLTNLDRVGHDDFKDGKAQFIFAPLDEEEA